MSKNSISLEKHLIGSDRFTSIFKMDPFVLVDAGARGGLTEPWNFLNPDHLIVHGFEPDEAEAHNLMDKNYPNRYYHPVGLWNNKQEVILHLNKVRSTSSIYPPNSDRLAEFPDKNIVAREVVKQVKIPCNSLDNVLSDTDSVDFLKVDVHSAEYELIEGARNQLDRNIFGVTIEMWCIEAHKGQHLWGEVISLMHQLGFEPMLMDADYMKWPHKYSSKYQYQDRKSAVGCLVLFFKKSNMINNWSDNKKFKAAAIAEIYGYPGKALTIIDQMTDSDLKVLAKSHITKLWETTSTYGIKDKLRNKLMTLVKKLLTKLETNSEIYKAPIG